MMPSTAFSCSFCEAPRSALLTYQSKVSGIQTPTCFLPRLDTKSRIFLKARRKDFGIKDMDGLHCLNTMFSRICLRRFISTRCSMDASFGGSSPNFPRINVRDPYKRLGISREASQEEVLAARTFLVNQYSGHKPSVDAIESAYDKILSENLKERRRTKFDFQGKWKKLTQSRVAKFIGSRFGAPSLEMILKTGALFLALGIWSFLNPTEDGPVYQKFIVRKASPHAPFDNRVHGLQKFASQSSRAKTLCNFQNRLTYLQINNFRDFVTNDNPY